MNSTPKAKPENSSETIGVEQRNHVLPFSPIALILEFVQRSTIIWLWMKNHLSDAHLWGLSSILTILLGSWCFLTWVRLNKDFEKTASRPLNVTVGPGHTIIGGLTILLSILSFLQFCLFTSGMAWLYRLPLVTVLTLLAVAYSAALALRSVRGVAPLNNWDKKSETDSQLSSVEQDVLNLAAVDSNDQEILRLESEIDSLTRRVEAFTLEGALIGALAFGAFVTIVSSQDITADSIRHLFLDSSRIGICATHLDTQCIVRESGDLIIKDRLLSLIALLALISSVLFLSVIIARLRFAALLAPFEYFVKLSSNLNEKEEHFKDLITTSASIDDSVTVRLTEIRNDIDVGLAHAKRSLLLISPVMTYMVFFRHAGVLAFMASLIVSALWISHVLALLFLVLCGVAYLYPYLDEFVRRAARKNNYFHRLTLMGKHFRSL